MFEFWPIQYISMACTKIFITLSLTVNERSMFIYLEFFIFLNQHFIVLASKYCPKESGMTDHTHTHMFYVLTRFMTK